MTHVHLGRSYSETVPIFQLFLNHILVVFDLLFYFLGGKSFFICEVIGWNEYFSSFVVMKTFVCRGCVNPVTSTGRTSVDNGVHASLELVDKFCYLGDMLNVYGDADAAVETRIQLDGINSGSWYHCLPIRIYH